MFLLKRKESIKLRKKMKLNDKDKFIGVAVLIIIIGIASSLYTINLPDKSNIPINQENPNIPNNQIKETISN